MLLILLLILSQDAGFVTACQTSILSSVPWYKDRLLGKISVGSLMVIVLVRTVQTNLAGVHDSYVHTNCLAALANIAPLLRKLHPHAARCLISLNDLFARKYLKLVRASSSNEAGGGGSYGDEGGLPPTPRGNAMVEAPSPEALQMSIDFLRIALEAVNLCLIAGPSLNEHLIYALLERQSVFARLREHELFADLVINIDLVLEHFGATLRAEPQVRTT